MAASRTTVPRSDRAAGDNRKKHKRNKFFLNILKCIKMLDKPDKKKRV